MAGSSLVTAATLEPVTVEEARSQCRLTDSSEDGLLAGYLLTARHLAEARTGRVFATESWAETYDYDWPCGTNCVPVSQPYCGPYLPRRIMLPRAPVQSVTSVTYSDTTGTTQTLNPNQYRVGKHQLIAVIDPEFGVAWPAVRYQIDTITVTYVAGYSTPSAIPETVRQAILLLVAHYYRNREATVESLSRLSVTELPIGVDALLAPHVVPWVF